jgi:hypothetical protein
MPALAPAIAARDMVQPGENLLDRIVEGRTLGGLMVQLPDDNVPGPGHPKVVSVLIPTNRARELRVWRVNHNASGWYSEGNAALEWGWTDQGILGLHLERNLLVHPQGVDTIAIVLAVPSEWLIDATPLAIVPTTPTVGKGTCTYRTNNFSHLSRLKSYPVSGQPIPANVVQELDRAREEGGIFLPPMPADKLSIRDFVQYPQPTVSAIPEREVKA